MAFSFAAVGPCRRNIEWWQKAISAQVKKTVLYKGEKKRLQMASL
jgi:hypothetical protein